MSEAIKHECGIALLQLKKPLSFYKDKYGHFTELTRCIYLWKSSMIKDKMELVLQA